MCTASGGGGGAYPPVPGAATDQPEVCGRERALPRARAGVRRGLGGGNQPDEHCRGPRRRRHALAACPPPPPLLLLQAGGGAEQLLATVRSQLGVSSDRADEVSKVLATARALFETVKKQKGGGGGGGGVRANWLQLAKRLQLRGGRWAGRDCRGCSTWPARQVCPAAKPHPPRAPAAGKSPVSDAWAATLELPVALLSCILPKDFRAFKTFVAWRTTLSTVLVSVRSGLEKGCLLIWRGGVLRFDGP